MSIQDIKTKSLPFAQKYALKSLSVFGSIAMGAENPNDVDFLVEFNETPSIFKVMGLREELKNALQKEVDLVTLPLPRADLLNIEKSVRIYG